MGRYIFFLCLSWLLIACTTPGSPAQPTDVTSELDGTEWVLESIGGQSLVEDTNITLEFDDEKISGYSGCNFYGGGYTIDKESLKFLGIGTTMIGCDGPVAQQETRYLTAFGYDESVAYRRSEGRLELEGDDGVQLIFVEQPQLLMNPADLIGTAWLLQTLNGAALASDEPVTLTFPAAGTFRGVLGCIDYSGKYIAEGDDIWFAEHGYAYTRCQNGDELEGVEVEVSVGGVTDYRLGDGKLELLTYSGDTFLFTAQP